MSTTTPWRVRLTASPSELHGPRRLRHGTPRFPRPCSRTVVGGPLRAHGPSFVGRPFRRSKAVTPSTTLHGPTLARVRASAHSRGREKVKRQCSDGGFCRQNLVSEKRRLRVISSDLQPPSGLLHPHPTCRCPRPEASCRTHPPYPCCCGLSVKAALCFSWLRGAPGCAPCSRAPPVVVVVVVNHQTAPRTRVNWTKIPAGIAVNFSFVVVNPTAGGRNRKKPDQDLQNF